MCDLNCVGMIGLILGISMTTIITCVLMIRIKEREESVE